VHDTTCDHDLRAMSLCRARRDQPCAHRPRTRVGTRVGNLLSSGVGSTASSATLRAVGCPQVAALAVSGCTGSADQTAATDVATGRVMAIATADVLEPGSAVPLGVLDPGATADAVVVLNGPVAPMQADVSPMLWAVGRP